MPCAARSTPYRRDPLENYTGAIQQALETKPKGLSRWKNEPQFGGAQYAAVLRRKGVMENPYQP